MIFCLNVKRLSSLLKRIKLNLSDEDIEHLHSTVPRVLEIMKAFQFISAVTKGEEEIQKINKQPKSYEQIRELISVDTLKTM